MYIYRHFDQQLSRKFVAILRDILTDSRTERAAKITIVQVLWYLVSFIEPWAEKGPGKYIWAVTRTISNRQM